MNQASTVDTQIFYARIAGFVYLLLIVLFMSGEFLISGIVGDGDFAARAQDITSSERLYRIALALQILVPVLTVVLAHALYITVRPVNERLAQMAMFWRLGESFIGAAVMILGFVMVMAGRHVPETRDPMAHGRLDIPGAALVGLGLAGGCQRYQLLGAGGARLL